ncbi:MAG: GNAT family N-acetyltransferase [Chloroflexota bacterium]|nr:GNAT family N-acetyltransferase [Anaerolineae bacterium]
MLSISEATTNEQLDAVRTLIRTFVAWHRQRHNEDLALIDQYFDAKDFEAELAGLPGKYAPAKRGWLLLATYDGQAAGCVALREIDTQRCEMKRMFVYPEFQGKKVGRGLAETLIGEAKSLGYSTMLLDTSYRQVEALSLYASMGFKKIDPYYELPPELTNWLVFMQLSL